MQTLKLKRKLKLTKEEISVNAIENEMTYFNENINLIQKVNKEKNKEKKRKKGKKKYIKFFRKIKNYIRFKR